MTIWFMDFGRQHNTEHSSKPHKYWAAFWYRFTFRVTLWNLSGKKNIGAKVLFFVSLKNVYVIEKTLIFYVKFIKRKCALSPPFRLEGGFSNKFFFQRERILFQFYDWYKKNLVWKLFCMTKNYTRNFSLRIDVFVILVFKPQSLLFYLMCIFNYFF